MTDAKVLYDMEFHFSDGDACLIYNLTEDEIRKVNATGVIEQAIDANTTDVYEVQRAKLNYVKTIRRLVQPEAQKVIA